MSSALALPVRRRPPQDIAGRAHRVLHAALAERARWTREPKARQEIAQACEALDKALDEFGALDSGTVTWEAFYAELASEEDPHAAALDKAAEEAALAMTMLLMTLAATSGTELADAVKAAA